MADSSGGGTFELKNGGTHDYDSLTSGGMPLGGEAEVEIVGMANVDGDLSGRVDVVAVGRPGTLKAGHVFVGIASSTGTRYWTWESTQRMLDDGAKRWLADVNGDGRTDLVSQGAANGNAAGWVVVGLSTGTGFEFWSWASGHRMLDDDSKSWLADDNGDGKADLISQGGAQPGGRC